MAFDINDELPDRESARQFYQKYEPKEVLGKGLSSVVRKCVEKATGKEYACKIMEFNDDSGEECAATLREIRILKLVGGHPNIIDIVASFETPNYVFIVMELCPYGELFDYLTKVVRLSEKRTRQIMSSILQGVHHLHSYRVVHRDLKPENILMDSTMNVKITDLGFAAQIEDNQSLYDLFGTPVLNPADRYTAEQALQHPFFISEKARRKDFMAKRTLKAHIILVWSIYRLRTLHYRPQPIRGKDLLENPYRFKSYRKMIDSTAFLLYGHWIKKDEHRNQNRATLFQTEEKCDLVRHEQ
ncbi:unnamed protein product [Rotaria magnacalcarata]|uniref:Protein kinase domain-containing protein n=1 Tax=Rotaria magnacalcarata TaxID=392030 RepID=A0A8S2SJG1_9BILA|nr:unnamed protein product [Rotaria magnacalcarata]